jgi:hypothetical protein
VLVKRLIVLTSAYGEYAMKKLRFLRGICGSRKGEKMCKMTQEVGSQNLEGQMQIWTDHKSWYSQIKD